MSNHRAPQLQRYVVVLKNRTAEATREEYHYFRTKKEAKEWAAAKVGWRKKQLFAIAYDFHGDVK